MLCIDNGTTDPQALEEMRDAPVERIVLPGVFNFSKANNLGLKHATGEYLVFMNNDIEILSPDWIQQMLYYAQILLQIGQFRQSAVRPMLSQILETCKSLRAIGRAAGI